MDIHKHHLGKTLFASLYCVHSVVETSRLYFRGSAVDAHCFPTAVCPLTVTTPSFQPDITASVLSGPVASCGSFSSNVETFQYTLQNRTGPLQNNLLRFQLGCVSPWTRWWGPRLDKHSLCVQARGITFLGALIFFFPPKFCGVFFSYILYLFC